MRNLPLDLRRALEVFRVSLKYGFGPFGQLFSRLLRTPSRDSSTGVRLKLALEELGLTYLKLGQFLAMRFDIIPADVSRELQKLFEGITPATFEEIRSIVEVELGGPLGQFYASFNRRPTAAASVAQVHEARTRANERVAVKVQRPGIQRIFAADMRNLRRMACLIDLFGIFGNLSAREMVDEFARWTLRELDFTIEGRTADRLRRNALGYECVPEILWSLTTPRVLTMEFIDGISLAQLSQLFEAGGEELVKSRLPNIDLPLVLSRLATASMHQLFDIGLFHGDPHPGNVIVRDDNTFAFVDFGIFGELSRYERTNLTRHIEAIAAGNIAESLRYYSKQLFTTSETDQRAFREAAMKVFRRWYDASQRTNGSVQARHLGKYSGEMMELVRRYRLRMSMSTLLFWRAMNALDSSALRFPGYFDLLGSMRLFFQRGRHNPLYRAVRENTNLDRSMALYLLLRDSPDQVGRTLRDFAGREPKWPIQQDEARPTDRLRNGQTRALSLTLVGASLAMLAAASPLEPAARALILVLTIPMSLWALREVS